MGENVTEADIEAAIEIYHEIDTTGADLLETLARDVLAPIIARTRRQADITCHNGHTTMQVLWDCPVCMAKERKDAEVIKEKLRALNAEVQAALKEVG